MNETLKAPVFNSANCKDISNLIKTHLSDMDSHYEKIKAALKNAILSDNLYGDQQETALLMELSYEVAATSNKEDLFKSFYSKFKSLLGMLRFAVCIIQEDEATCQAFEIDENIYNTDKKSLSNPGNKASDIPGSLFDQLRNSEKVFTIDLRDNPEHTLCGGYLDTWKVQGIEKVSVIVLSVGDNIIGLLYLPVDFDNPGSIPVKLITAMGAQLAVALSNILLLEKSAERKKEMELLLSINTEIASVRNAKELGMVIKHNFKKLLGCSHTGIAISNEDGTTVSAFLLDEEANGKSHPSFNEAKKGLYPLSDPILSEAIHSNTPVFFDLDKLASVTELPLYVKVNYENGQKSLVATRFDKDGEIFGFWLLFYKDKNALTKDKIKLIQTLSHQLCISVANIIAHQEIKKRELEKGRLLEFSNAIASVRDMEVLSRILKVQLYELLNIENYILFSVEETLKSTKPFLYDHEGLLINYIELLENDRSDQEYRDSFLDLMLAENGPVLYKMETGIISYIAKFYILEPGNTDENFLIGIAIQIGLERIAVMTFTHADYLSISKQNILLKSICSQIAISIANITANEQVREQLVEINGFKRQLEEETIYLKEEIEVNQNYTEIVGDSPVMQKIFRLVTQVAPTDSTVLILGETGTGKELIARAIHNNSPRKNKLMVKVNCAALPANLIESELFGHERGSFTGATERRLGKFELANNGTLFLDEIGEMPLELQVKLLRALQEKEIERVGGRGTIKVDVRIIAATNRDLEKEVDEGRFRSDLYYRLNIFPIKLSALRERTEDIPELATYFIHRYAKKTGRQITTLSSKALSEMMTYSWPGNIRELEHLIERSILLSTGETLKHIHLPSLKTGSTVTTSNGEVQLKTIDENECEHILKILKYTQGRISGPGGASDILGVPPSTLNSKIKRLGIKKEHLVDHV